MTQSDYLVKLDYYTNLFGQRQVKDDEGIKWGYNAGDCPIKMKKAFIYLNTLSRYSPEGSNSINQQDAEFIFLQLEKLKL